MSLSTSPTATSSPRFYPAAMNDAVWERVFAMLIGSEHAPNVAWPPGRVRVVRGLSGDRVDDDDLPLRYVPPGCAERPVASG